MLDRIIVNTLYLVPLQVNKFKKQHPNEEVLIADGTKARKVKSNEEAQYEMGWATARRSILILTTQELFCGDWTIALSDVQVATLLHIPGGSVLKVSTKDGLHYQFGMQRNPAWEKQKVLPLTVQETVLNYSRTSLILRLLVLAWLAYIIGQDYVQNGLSTSGVIYILLFVWIGFPLLRRLISSRQH
jgi:hypothetical protein